MEACQFDGGDCCQKSLIGNGICEEANNFASCGNFDGGDCKGKINIFFCTLCPKRVTKF